MEDNKKRKREEEEHHHHHDDKHGHEHGHHHHHHHHHDDKHEHEHKVKRHEVAHDGDEKELTWEHIVKKTTVGDLCSRKAVQKPLVTLKDTTTLRQAMDTLSENSILSAPVLDAHSHKFLGFVDVLDIVGFIFTTYGKKSDKFDDPHFVKDEFFHSEVKKLLNFSKVDTTVEVSESASIAELIALFADPSRYHRLHRVAVVDSHKKLVNVVSQSDVIALAVSNLSAISAEKKNATLASLNIISKPIFSRIDDPFMDTLETLYTNRVSGLALIDNEARISANFSASDLRGMNDSAFRYFSGSTLSFLVKGTDAKLGAPVQCLDTTTFGDALSAVYENKIHRLYIVTDLGEHISGVVSVSDLVPLLGSADK